MHCTIDSETTISDVIDLRQEIKDILQEPEYLHLLSPHMLSIDPNRMNPIDLRAWLFETYTLCNNFEACNDLNTKVKSSFEYVQSALRADGVEVRTSVLCYRENWS